MRTAEQRIFTKRIIAAVSALVLLFSICGCGGGESAVGGKEGNTESAADGMERNVENTPAGKKEKIETDMQTAPYLIRAAETEGGLYGYLDVRNGEWALSPRFSWADVDFDSDGWACVTVGSDQSNTTMINTAGEYVFEPGSFDRFQTYEMGECYIAHKDKTKCLLYRGSTLVKELEYPIENVVEAQPWNAEPGNYTPNRCIVIRVRNDADELYYCWYDRDGNFICYAEEATCLIQEGDKYYFVSKECEAQGGEDRVVNVSDRSLTSKVAYVGDKWFACFCRIVRQSTGQREFNVCTNGFTPFFTAFWGLGCSVAAGDGIVTASSDGDIHYLKPDGSVVYHSQALHTYYSFQNGYTKIEYADKNSEDRSFSGFIDTDGRHVLQIERDELNAYSEVLPGGYIVFKKNGLCGIMDINGNVTVEPKYAVLYTMK